MELAPPAPPYDRPGACEAMLETSRSVPPPGEPSVTGAPRPHVAPLLEPHGSRAGDSATTLLDEDVEEALHARVRRKSAEKLERFRAFRTRSDGRTEAADGASALIEVAREHRISTPFLPQPYPASSKPNRSARRGARTEH